MKPTTRR